MIDIAKDRLGAPRALSRAYAEILGGLDLGSMYVHGGRAQPLDPYPSQGNPITSDARALQAQPPSAGGSAGAGPLGLADYRLAAH